MSRNNITGDKIQTKGILSKEGEENFDRIFRKKTEDPIKKDFPHNILKDTNEPIKLTQEEWAGLETIEALIEIHKEKQQSRIDTVGQNGNDGLHYEYELDKSTGEVVKVDSKRLTDAHNGL